MYRMLIKQDLSRFDLSSIEHASTAGEALNPEVFNKFKEATGEDLDQTIKDTKNQTNQHNEDRHQ